jgi:elongation factor 1-gamma
MSLCGPLGSPGCLLVRAAAHCTGQSLVEAEAAAFLLQYGALATDRLTDPAAAALHVTGAAREAGEGPAGRAQVLAYLLYATGDLRHCLAAWVAPTLGPVAGWHPGLAAGSRREALHRLAALDTALATRTFLVGERLTLADLATALALLPAFRRMLEPEWRAQHRHLVRWWNTVLHQPAVEALVGEVQLCEKEAEVVKEAAKSKEKKDTAPKQKKEAAPKEKKEPALKKEKMKEKLPTPKKESPEKVVAPKEEGDVESPDTRKAGPLDQLPQGTFDLEAWKRFYSNNEEAASCEYFWQHFDPACYSVWRADYRFNSELDQVARSWPAEHFPLPQVFMSCNLMAGMFQRLDKLAKHAFASACLWGEKGDLAISAVWVLKGHELAFEASEDWQVDYPSYEWTRLDTSLPEARALVEQYWRWEGKDLQGRRFNQGKVFK